LNLRDKECFFFDLLLCSKELGPITFLPVGEIFNRWLLEGIEYNLLDGINFIGNDRTTYNLFSDKDSFLNLCKKNGLEIPKRLSANFALDSEPFVKFVIKSKKYEKNDLLSKGPILVENRETREILKRQYNFSKYNDYIFEEYIEGLSYYYCALFKKDKKKLEFIQKNLIQQPGGKSIFLAIPSSLPKHLISYLEIRTYMLFYEPLLG
jgi:hypothetical protein